MKNKVVLAAVCALFLLSLTNTSYANRAERWEVFFTRWTTEGDEMETISEVNDRWPGDLIIDDYESYGIGVGYNISNRINLNAIVTFGSVDIDAENFPADSDGNIAEGQDPYAKGNFDAFAGSLNLDYYFLQNNFSPYISGGVGFFNLGGRFDEMRDRGAATDNREDWEGYDVTGTTVSYNTGVGIRWDMTARAFLKLEYNKTWTEINEAEDWSELTSTIVNLGVLF